MQNDLSAYRTFGEDLALAAAGVGRSEFTVKRAAVEGLSDGTNEGYGSVQRLVCRYAAAAFAGAGHTVSPHRQIFMKLASCRPWSPSFDPYSDAVLAAVGRVHGEIREMEAGAAKSALVKAASAALLPSVMGGMARLTPDVLKLLLTGGAVAGITGGSLAWMGNRGVREDDAELEAMKARIGYYDKVRREIEEEMQSQSIPSTPEEIEDTVEDFI